jgi:hypothetical protein
MVIYETSPDEPASDDPDEEQQHWIDMVNQARMLAVDHIRVNEERNKKDYDKHANPRVYYPGDLVYIKAKPAPFAPLPKLRPRYVGPYRITELKDHQAKVVAATGRDPQEITLHRDEMRHCYEIIEEETEPGTIRRGPGRPKGSKNKPKQGATQDGQQAGPSERHTQ